MTDLSDYQSKLQAWVLWNNQSSEYKLNNPEPPNPEKGNNHEQM